MVENSYRIAGNRQGGYLVSLLFPSVWWKKVWQMKKLPKRLAIEWFYFGRSWMIRQIRQTFLLYGIYALHFNWHSKCIIPVLAQGQN